MGHAGGAAAAQRRPWQRRLTAASYRYFVRGPAEGPGPDDVKIKDPGMRRLAPYDHMLRKFQCAPCLPVWHASLGGMPCTAPALMTTHLCPCFLGQLHVVEHARW